MSMYSTYTEIFAYTTVVYVHVQGDIVLNGHNGNADFPQVFHKGGTGGRIVKVMPHIITITLIQIIVCPGNHTTSI